VGFDSTARETLRIKMNAYEKAQELGLTGTDSEIVAQLKATGLTANKIRLADLLFTLNNRGMLVRLIRPADTGEKWAGTVVNMVLYLNDSGSPEQAAAVNQWFSHITNDRNEFFDTTLIPFASTFWALAQALGGGPGMPSPEDFEAVAALGGGWLFSDLTEAQYAAQRQAAIDQAAKKAALDLVANTASEAAREEWRKAESTPETIMAAALAVLGGE
jgi:hypothetical protein